LSLIREIPPTAGWPLKISSLGTALFQKHPHGLLEEEFKKYLHSPLALLTYSGTAAFYIILETIKKLSPKKTVVIPSFVCPLIPLAIRRAGLKIKLCDINPDNFDFDILKLKKICSEDKDILAIVAVHLAGLPLNLELLQGIAKENDIFVIEDCAQSLGAEYHGKKTGSFGDFAFFSLCRGKGLTIYEGGIAATRLDQYAAPLKATAQEIMRPAPLSESLKIAEVFAYSIFYRPALFWFAFRLPQIFWLMRHNPVRAMGEYFDTEFPVHPVSGFREYIGYLNFPALDKEIAGQKDKTDYYLNTLKNLPGVRPITQLPQSKASYPYLAIILKTPKKKEAALRYFNHAGLGISQIYLYAITDYAYLKRIVPEEDCENARTLALRTITLSTSSFLTRNEQDKILKKLETILKS